MIEEIPIIRDYRYRLNDNLLGNDGSLITFLDSFMRDQQGCSILPPESIILSSSSELFILTAPEAKSFMQAVCSMFPKASVRFSSLACLGFYAAVLDFLQSGDRNALVLLLETPGFLPQYCLNAIGAGQGGIGLNAQEGFAVAYLEKIPRERLKVGMMIVNDCQIFGQPEKINGVLKCIRKSADCIMRLQSEFHSKIVSFELPLQWSEQMLKGFRRTLSDPHKPENWLKGCETEARHYLTLKPIMELSLHKDVLKETGLITLTLGAGGRLGLLQVSRHNDGNPSISSRRQKGITPRICDFNSDLKKYRSIADCFSSPGNWPRIYEEIRQNLYYFKTPAERKDNLFYKWILK